MTVTVAVEADGGALIGSDSCVSDPSVKYITSGPKWWRTGDVVIGYAGEMDGVSVLRGRMKLPPVPSKGDPTLWADRILLPRVRALIEDTDADWPELLIVVRGRVIVSCGDIYYPASGYAAIGSGAQAALGSLATSFGGAKSRVTRAVKAAIHHAPGCEGTVHTEWVPR